MQYFPQDVAGENIAGGDCNNIMRDHQGTECSVRAESAMMVPMKKRASQQQLLSSKFTPMKGRALQSANRSSNWSKWSFPVMTRPQPMTEFYSPVSIINMPSLTQGQFQLAAAGRGNISARNNSARGNCCWPSVMRCPSSRQQCPCDSDLKPVWSSSQPHPSRLHSR